MGAVTALLTPHTMGAPLCFLPDSEQLISPHSQPDRITPRSSAPAGSAGRWDSASHPPAASQSHTWKDALSPSLTGLALQKHDSSALGAPTGRAEP